MIRICLHGAESTGKSTLAARLAARFGCRWVPEYGREYCETRGIELAMADLLAIAAGQDAAMRAAAAEQPRLLILDTDPLMSAAWAEMLFGEVPGELLAYPKAEHYLLFAPDVPWRADGTRFFGEAGTRARFAGLARQMVERAGVSYTLIEGAWEAREEAAANAIERLL
ncbi:MAG TPA: ATP-binding protein [Novosphingobium sp.]|nr:ATP-binding protein [Novosphingobium sp.]